MTSPNISQQVIDERASLDLRTYEGQRSLAAEMRSDDLRSRPDKRPPGAEALIERMQIWAAHNPGLQVDKWISPEHLRRYLSKHLKGNEIRYVDLGKEQPFVRSYLVRLAAVKTIFNLKEQLTEAEAKAALRVYYEFNDPHGETVDLIPQVAIVHEIAERESNSRPIHDIDDYFAYAPWKSDANKDLYSFALNQNKAIPPQLRLICPFIPVFKPKEDKFRPHDFQVGAHAYLGMPYALNYSTTFGSGENPKETRYKIMPWDSQMLDIDPSPEESKHLCHWQVQLKAAMAGDFSPAVNEITFDVEEEAKEPTLTLKESGTSND